jgi:hypothetical protein
MSEKNLQNSDDQEYWKFVERTAREVRETPKWMGGDESDDESSSSVQLNVRLLEMQHRADESELVTCTEKGEKSNE